MSVQSSPFIFTEAKPSPSLRPTKLLSSVPEPTSESALPVEPVEMTSPMREEPVLSTRLLFLLLANITAASPPPSKPLLMISAFASLATLIPFWLPCTVPLLLILLLPSLNATPSPAVPVMAPLLSNPRPICELRPFFPLITPVSVLVILIADDSSLTKIPLLAPVMIPLLLKSPAIDCTLTALSVADEIIAFSLLLISTGCASILIFRPIPEPEIFPSLVTFSTFIPLTDTAGVLSAEETVTSLLMTYSVSAEKSCGTEVDWSIVPALTTIGVNINKAGNILASVLVVLFSSKCLLLIYTSICVNSASG